MLCNNIGCWTLLFDWLLFNTFWLAVDSCSVIGWWPFSLSCWLLICAFWSTVGHTSCKMASLISTLTSALLGKYEAVVSHLLPKIFVFESSTTKDGKSVWNSLDFATAKENDCKDVKALDQFDFYQSTVFLPKKKNIRYDLTCFFSHNTTSYNTITTMQDTSDI